MKPNKDFKTQRWTETLNTWLQVLLFLVFFAGASYLGSHFYTRVDLTKQHRFSLSPETIAYLGELERPVQVYVTISADSDDPDLHSLYQDTRGLLREYEFQSRRAPGGGISVEFVNVYQQRGKARLLADTYGIDQSELILLVSGDKQRIVFPNELYVTEGRKRTQFKGEQKLTSAILDVASDNRKTIYILSGHGELRVDDVDPNRGISQFTAALRQRNFDLRTLNLTHAEGVPEDADMILILSPQTPVMPHEEEMLRQYLNNEAGRVLIMIDPELRNNHGLDDLFFDWGVLVDDTVVLDTGRDFMASGGDLLLWRFGDHATTRTLIDNNIPVIAGLTRSIRKDPGRPIGDSLQVTPLIGTSDSSWGERNYNYARGGTYRFDENTDLPGPLSVATLSERQIASNLPINIPGGRLIVIGTSEFITNSRIGALGNLTLMLNLINWGTDRDSMVNIPPRPIDDIQIVLSQDQTNKLRLSMLVLFPGSAALCGLIVYWMRRK